MAEPEMNRDEELRRLLTDAIEVQLAALKAGIGFWTELIEQTSAFVSSATKTLSSINSEQQTRDILLELVDAGRASARALTDIPRHTATRFIEELDRLEDKKQKALASSARKKAATKRSGSKAAGKKKTAAKKVVAKKAAAKKTRSRPGRAGRVKE